MAGACGACGAWDGHAGAGARGGNRRSQYGYFQTLNCGRLRPARYWAKCIAVIVAVSLLVSGYWFIQAVGQLRRAQAAESQLAETVKELQADTAVLQSVTAYAQACKARLQTQDSVETPFPFRRSPSSSSVLDKGAAILNLLTK